MTNNPDDLFNREKQIESKLKVERKDGEPTPAFKGASLAALIIGVSAYLTDLFNAAMELNEKGYYFATCVDYPFNRL